VKHLAYISGGSNLGDRREHLDRAITLLAEKAGRVRKISSLYETEPVGFRDQPWFLNVALELETGLAPEELLHHCWEIENGEGRTRPFANAPRTLDLDLLLYDDLVLATPSLVVPHPRMAERRFVLEPLAEIAPDVLHPVLKATIRALAASCPDSAKSWITADGRKPSQGHL
jgi:2-amino-4-hydroxy-6-hydroxymethyldihydropteridine diphosphokinase